MNNEVKKIEIQNPHDVFARESLSKPEVARDLVKNYIEKELVDLLDLSTLKVVKDSFIDGKYKEHFSDCLYKIKTKDNKEVYVYTLVEHKSNVDRNVPLQLLKYMTMIWDRELTTNKNKKLPLIIPIVLYHGKARWSKKITLENMFERSSSDFRKYIPTFQYVLLDLYRYADNEIIGEKEIRAIFLTLKHVMGEELAKTGIEIIRMIKSFPEQEKAVEYLKRVLIYMLTVGQAGAKEELHEKIKRETKGDPVMIPLIDEWIEKGKKEGKKEQSFLMLMRLLGKKIGELSVGAKNKIAKLSLQQMENLGEALLDFNSPKDLNQWLKEH